MRLAPLALAMAVAACVTRIPLDVSLDSMSNPELLRYYYSLTNEAENAERDVRAMQSQYATDRVFGGFNAALSNALVQGVFAGQGNAYRRRAIDARVELERRGWTPARGLPETQPGMANLVVTGHAPPPSAAPAGAFVVPAAVPPTGSRWMYSAEQLAKARGCVGPAATLNFTAPGAETFSMVCTKGEPLSIRCEMGQCRVLD